jgi:hypothetical protein
VAGFKDTFGRVSSDMLADIICFMRVSMTFKEKSSVLLFLLLSLIDKHFPINGLYVCMYVCIHYTIFSASLAF